MFPLIAKRLNSKYAQKETGSCFFKLFFLCFTLTSREALLYYYLDLLSPPASLNLGQAANVTGAL